MSAFIVQKGTIDRIVTYIEKNKHNWQIKFDVVDEKELGQKLWDLNARAVNFRYAENIAIKYDFFERKSGQSLVAIYKSIDCYLYQCLEGDVPESCLFRQIESVQKDLASRIIFDLPGYHECPWE